MKVGDQVRHINRQSVYEIVSLIPAGKMAKNNGENGCLVMCKNNDPDQIILVGFSAQISDKKNAKGEWLLYRQCDVVVPLYFARPTVEFTPDRFELLGV